MDTVFAMVLNMSATGSAVIAAILLARLLLRNVPKKWSYLLWSVAGFRLACPVSLGAAFSAFSLLRDRTFFQHEAGQISTMELLPLHVGGGSSSSPGPDWTAPFAGAAVPVGPDAAAQMPDPVTIAAWVWLAVMLALLLYGVLSYWRTWRTLHTAFRVEGNLWQSEAVRSPFILGVFRPRIYIPLGLEGEELRYVLAHERYHLRHGDHLVRLFAFLLLAVHWFNPLCWLAYALCGQDMEMRCDEAVLDSREGIRKAYSRALLSFAEGRRFPRPSPLAFGEASVKSRIRNALRWKRPRTWMTALAAALCVAVIAACGANPDVSEEEAQYRDMISTFQPGGAAQDGEGPAVDGEAPEIPRYFTGGGAIEAGIEAFKRLKAYPDSYSEIVERTDLVVRTPDDLLLNGQLWKNFWNSVQHRESADVVLARFTVDGDPVLNYLSFDGSAFYFMQDTTRDKFAGGLQYMEAPYRFLQRLETPGMTVFVLTDEEFPDYYSWQEKAEEDYDINEKHPRIILSLLTRTGYEQNPDNTPPAELPYSMSPLNDWGITMTTKDVTATGLTLEITQSGGAHRGKLLTGEDFVVERRTDGEILAAYAEVPYIADEDIYWRDIGIAVPLNDTRELKVDWSWFYGELPPGQYRIGKRFMDLMEPGEYDESMIYAYFTIPDGNTE